MPLPSLACVLNANGISAPSFAEILASLQETFQTIYGSDAYISADSQDGQLLAIFSQAMNDGNMQTIATYNSFSPTFAQGVGLSSVVKINGIRRLVPSLSTATGTVIGQTGTLIAAGVVKDVNGNLWNLPLNTLIPGAGTVDVTVTAQEPGSLIVPAGDINEINTPTYGWQSFVSITDSIPGAPVESDATLRRRQSLSTSIAAETPLESMLGALSNLAGVTRVAVYENFTDITDANGLPRHSISVVISGGDDADIAEIIGQKKTPGAATYGTTIQAYTDPITGIVYSINFFHLANITIKVIITGTALPGYSTVVVADIKAAVAAYLNGLDIGTDVQYTRTFSPAYLNGALDGATYEVAAITIAKGAGPPGVADIVIAFNEAAVCDVTVDVTVTIT